MKLVVLLGCQISIATGLSPALSLAADVGARCFQFFTRNPRGSSARKVSGDEIAEFAVQRAAVEPFPLIAHLPYTVNMMSSTAATRVFSEETVAEDICRMVEVGADALVMHPGSRLRQSKAEALAHLTTALERSVLPGLKDVWFLLETMSGSGSEVGSIADIGEIIQNLGRPANLGVCLDTCHLFASGYDLRRIDEITRLLCDVDTHIGLDRVRCVHVNDSKFGPGLHKDRHARVGEGHIGRDGLCNVLTRVELSGLPFILETPVDDPKDYATEISRLRRWLVES